MSDEETAEAESIRGVGEETGQLLLSGKVPLDSIELDQKAVDLLFDANSLHLTRAQMQVVVEAERRHRAAFEEKKKARAAKKKKALPEEIENLKIEDLNLDLSNI